VECQKADFPGHKRYCKIISRLELDVTKLCHQVRMDKAKAETSTSVAPLVKTNIKLIDALVAMAYHSKTDFEPKEYVYEEALEGLLR